MANAPCAAPRLRPGLPWKGEQANPGLAGRSLSADGSPVFHRCVSPVGTGSRPNSRPVPAAAELPAAVFGVSELAARLVLRSREPRAGGSGAEGLRGSLSPWQQGGGSCCCPGGPWQGQAVRFPRKGSLTSRLFLVPGSSWLWSYFRHDRVVFFSRA